MQESDRFREVRAKPAAALNVIAGVLGSEDALHAQETELPLHLSCAHDREVLRHDPRVNVKEVAVPERQIVRVGVVNYHCWGDNV